MTYRLVVTLALIVLAWQIGDDDITLRTSIIGGAIYYWLRGATTKSDQESEQKGI